LLGQLGFLDFRKMRTETVETFKQLGVAIQDPTVPISGYSGGQQQGVAVARAVHWASRLLLLDEPTAALGVTQTRGVLDLIRRVRDAGVTVVLISHNMVDVLSVCDRIAVLRLGEKVAVHRGVDADVDLLVSDLTGASALNRRDK
jgi:simple sugar transport system ATP-binding protein